MLRPGARSVKNLGGLVAFAAVAYLAAQLAAGAGATLWDFPVLLAIFAAVAVAAAARMISHPRPVYAALYFVLVVIASAGLFVLLHAEFMAFALIIVYAGAILITYLFVLMLAQQAESEEDMRALAEYDRHPREPAAAVFVGLVLVAVLGDALFGRTPEGETRPGQPWPTADVSAAESRAWADLDAMPRARNAAIATIAPGFQRVIRREDGGAIAVRDGVASVEIIDAAGATRTIELPDSARPGNTQRVGLVLVASFPVSLELAGVILTMAMFGAVILARRQAELGDERRREAVGARRRGFDETDPEAFDPDRAALEPGDPDARGRSGPAGGGRA